jgi:hypothetical protein
MMRLSAPREPRRGDREQGDASDRLVLGRPSGNPAEQWPARMGADLAATVVILPG